MHTFKDLNPHPHKCQIDCTNHDQVINKLQVKSKDLYYFWRNYEWLYNKYYNEPRKTDTTEYEQKIKGYKLSIEQYESTISEFERKYRDLQREYQSVQTQNKSLESQNRTLENQCRNLQSQSKNLTLQVNSLIKDLQRKKQLSPQIQDDYKKEIKRLKDTIESYKDMESNLEHDLRESKLQISRLQAELENANDTLSSQGRKYQSSIRNLEENLDKMRLQIANQPNPSQFSNRSALMSQAQEISFSYSKIRQEAEHVINMEMQKTRSELKQQLGRMIFGLSERQLESVLVDQL